jgi:hypothetical protein
VIFSQRVDVWEFAAAYGLGVIEIPPEEELRLISGSVVYGGAVTCDVLA